MKKIHIILIAGAAILIAVLIVSAWVLVRSMKHGSRGPVLTQEERQWLDARNGTIRIGGDPNYPPLDFIDHGIHTGLSEDYFRLIEKRLGITFKRINPSSWKNLLEGCRAHEIDIIKLADNTAERRAYLLFTQPYFVVPTVILTHKGDSRTYTLDDLHGLRVGVTRDYAVHEKLRRNYPRLTLVPVKDDEVGIRMAASGEIDVMISDLPTASYLIEKIGVTNLRVAGETGISYNLSIGSRTDWPILNSILGKALSSITDEERDAIMERWITLEYNRYLYSRSFWLALIITAGFIMLSIGVVLLWNRSLHSVVRKRTMELNEYRQKLEQTVELRTAELQRANDELRRTNLELSRAMGNLKTLSGLLPICSSCKKIRNDNGYWEQMETYLTTHSDVDFSHSLCPDCAGRLYGDLGKKNR